MEKWAEDFAKVIKQRDNPAVIGSVLGVVVTPPPELKISIMEGQIFISEVYVLDSVLILEKGDEVLLIGSSDNQKFFCLGKVSRVGGNNVS